MHYLLRIFQTAILCTLILILSSGRLSAKIITFENSGYEFSADTTMVTFVNSAGIFDGTADYVEVLSTVRSKKNGLKGTTYHLIDLKYPYIKIYKIHVKDTLSKYNYEDTFRTDYEWTNIQTNKFNHNYELYYEVLAYVNQNWQSIYEQSAKQGNSISISMSPSNANTITVEQKQEEKVPPNLAWDGEWKTFNSKLKLKRNGNMVEGLIENKKFSGIVAGNKVSGKWSNMKFFNSFEPEGEFELIMSDDGTYITIRWKDKWLDWAKDSTVTRLP